MTPRLGLLVLALAACRGASSPPEPREQALALARAEARRDSEGVLRAGSEPARTLLALARVGDARAISRLTAALGDPGRRDEAAAALGIAGLLGAEVAAAEVALAALAEASPSPQVAAALGRIGGAGVAPVLGAMLGPGHPDALREAAALALGVLGRRKVAVDRAARAGLVAAAASAELPLARAAVYGLAHAAGGDAAADEAAALLRATEHADPEVRLWALTGLQRQKIDVAQARPRLEAALGDPDVWARVAGVRGLAQLGDPQALARLLALVDDEAAPLHAVLEAVAALAGRAELPADRAALGELHARAEARLRAAAPVDRTARARIACHLAALAVRGPDLRPPLRCAEGLGPEADRERMLVEAGLLGQEVGDPATRAARLAELAREPDPRVRAAAPPAIARVWGGPAEALLAGALGDRSAAVAGAAAEALQARFSAEDRPSAPGPALQAALVRRAGEARDSELYAALAGAIGAIGETSGLPACEAGLDRASPGVRAAARACVVALTRAEPQAPTGREAAALPPVDPAEVVGRVVTWRLTTARGPIEVRLDPTSAPWHVAALVDLTRRGFYDGLDFHRVVPAFVVQGGDPEGTGWGGPGFSLPSEPSEGRFGRGAVGIADAGKDSGGSQFFFMHVRAPHLEGRYTRVGEVVTGLEVVDALLVGDRIVRAAVEVR